MIEITAAEFYGILNEKGIHEDELQRLVVEKLKLKGKKTATAESCTGGYVSKRITDISGSADAFECGVCSYANRIKSKILGVKEETLAAFGAVSPETAKEMAQGVKFLAGADFGISTTGIAGPTGGSEDKPVGLVYFAVAGEEETIVIKGKLWDAADNSREGIRKLASSVILYYLLTAV